MPAMSKAQRRLMGMVYAYNKGELSLDGKPKALRRKIKSIADSMSAEDVLHFAKTRQDDLPERKSAALTYDQAVMLGNMVPRRRLSDAVSDAVDDEEESGIADKTLHDAAIGAALGGLVLGGAGATLGAGNDPGAWALGARYGLRGLLGGGLLGALVGAGRGIFGKFRR